jgi:uncharacterized protein (DUF1800 family)
MADSQTVNPQGDDRLNGLTEEERAVHVLNRLGYGPRPGDVARVLRMGVGAYIEAQLQPWAIDDDPALERQLASYDVLALSTAELMREYPLPNFVQREMRASGTLDTAAIRMAARRSFEPAGELSQARIARAIQSERQLQEVMVDFWLNHFNVYARKGPVRLFLIEYERDAVRPHALGDFRELLGAVAHSPAMLFYLDNWMSAAPEGAPRAASSQRDSGRRALAGRRATGLNENYARELLELHTLGVDGGYTQDDVVAVARAFTGWTINLRSGRFAFRPELHDANPKVVLGWEINSEGISEGEQVLDLLAQHPSTAQLISEKLVRRFVSDQPPAALVDRAAAVFLETQGDIQQVVRTIVTSPEFFSREAYRAKVKTPFEWLTSSIRGLDLDIRETRLLVGALIRLDQPLYGALEPTGYPDVAESWVSSGALLTRAQLGQRLARPAVRSADRSLSSKKVVDQLLPAIETDRLLSVIESSYAAAARPRDKTETAVSLTLASPEFQRK